MCNVKDNVLVFEVIFGVDVNDFISVFVDDVDFIFDIGKDIKGFKIVLFKEYLGEGVSEEVKIFVKEVVEMLKLFGVEVDEVLLLNIKYGILLYYVIVLLEVLVNLV